MGFKKDLSLGKKAEMIVQQLFNKHKVLQCTKSTTKDYDLDLGHQLNNFKVEIKFDLMSQRTGNIAIEYWNSKSNKPSGILATNSDFYVFVLPDGEEYSVWLTKTKTLVDYFTHNSGIRDVHGGDNNSHMRLYSKDDILNIFTRIDNLNTFNILELINEDD